MYSACGCFQACGSLHIWVWALFLRMWERIVCRVFFGLILSRAIAYLKRILLKLIRYPVHPVSRDSLVKGYCIPTARPVYLEIPWEPPSSENMISYWVMKSVKIFLYNYECALRHEIVYVWSGCKDRGRIVVFLKIHICFRVGVIYLKTCDCMFFAVSLWLSQMSVLNPEPGSTTIQGVDLKWVAWPK